MHQQFTIRLAKSGEDPIVAGLVVEGFLDKFRPVFGGRMDASVKIMEKWIQLEHVSGGVQTLVAESASDIVASVGVRTSESREDVMARGLWRTLTKHLGMPRAVWATTLLSYPRYAAPASEAYIERLVVTPEFQGSGLGRSLLSAAETLGRDAGRETVGLHVSGINVAALKLYESAGYEEVSRQKSRMTGYFLDIKEWIYLRKTL